MRIVEIETKFGNLHLCWHGAGLSDQITAVITDAVALAEARAACTCEACGKPGRLFKLNSWFLTACDEHGKGEPAAERRDLESVHVVYRIADGEPVPRARRLRGG
jgi:hypothetical protein